MNFLCMQKSLHHLDLLNKIMPIQSFLAIKVNLLNNADILQEKYEELWKNIGVDDSLDEMTVILGSQRKIGSLLSPFIGETTFLQEYYHDDSIISWSHYSVSSIEFWEKMYVILEKGYVNNILDRKEFGLDFSKIKSVTNKETPVPKMEASITGDKAKTSLEPNKLNLVSCANELKITQEKIIFYNYLL